MSHGNMLSKTVEKDKRKTTSLPSDNFLSNPLIVMEIPVF